MKKSVKARENQNGKADSASKVAGAYSTQELSGEALFVDLTKALLSIEMEEEEEPNQEHHIPAGVFQKIEAKKPPGSIFLGTLSRCYIHGCEVHILMKGKLVHVKRNEAVPPGFEKALTHFRSFSKASDLALLVYSDRIVILETSGKIRPVEDEA